jgi:hypothetical protein
LKLAFQIYLPKTGFGERTDKYLQSVPVYVTALANEYFEYLITGKEIQKPIVV